MPLIECVPNISEGRRPVVIDAVAAAIRETPARLLDVSSDPIHHRTVYTFAGDAAAVEAGALALFAASIPAIDLRRHAGGHPRMGAVDVVPFVPLRGVTMADCAELARRVGAQVATLYDLPVFLYEDAARRPDRRRLEEIRRGGFEHLADKLKQPEWTPDFGPSRPHPTAGASVIGARPFLIAFNVALASRDLAIARDIAAHVRERSGGLPSVKAMGVDLPDRGLVQVSMNLTDSTKTSVRQAFAAVAAEAARRHVAVAHSEIVGLVPAAAVADCTAADIQLDGPIEDRILERKLEAAALR